MATESEDLRAALVGLRKLKARVAELESERSAPIAIIGMACRFPGGANDVESYWSALREGRELVGPVPPDRWSADAYEGPPDTPGTIRSRRAGFLDDVARFDADFFGISHREARAMDPQQRLLLETAWHALEDAGRIAGLEGSNTGVYLGVALTDWDRRTLYHLDPSRQDVYAGTGTFNSVAAGRISYALGLRGPNVSLDTACSSSLVAIHLAVQALRSGECAMALAGGVNLLLSPDPTLYFSYMGALAPDGRCKAFDAAADGYVRAEGVGVVVLKRLDHALREGDRVLAVIRGSAINQDGRSNGLTAPSPDAQKELLRSALTQAGLQPGQVGVVEAHGTGTPLGDPIEIEAVRDVYAATVPAADTLWVSAVKTQVGHAEAAAGVAGLIKVVCALQHRELPGNLHFQSPNPRLPIGGTRIAFPTSLVPWDHRRVAGISSFGMSGTNAHLLVGAAPTPEPPSDGRRRNLLVLSAPDDDRLRDLVGRAMLRLGDPGLDFDDAVFTAQAGRTHHGVRLAVVADGPSTAAQRMATWLREGAADGVASGTPGRPRPRLGLWFDDEPAVSLASLQELAPREPALQRILERCGATSQLALPEDLAGEEAFITQIAIAMLLQAWGVKAVAVGGAGQGEWVAAVLAGVMTVEDALTALRARDGDGWEDVLAGITLRRPALWFTAASTGGLLGVQAATQAHWLHWKATRGESTAAAQALRVRGQGLIVSLGRTVPADLTLAPWGGDPEAELLDLLGQLYVRGIEPAWTALHPFARRRVAWPRTRFDGPRLWIDDPVEALRAERRQDALGWQETWEPAPLSPQPAPTGWWVIGPPLPLVDAHGRLARTASLDEALAGLRHGERVVVHVDDARALASLRGLILRASEVGATVSLWTHGFREATSVGACAAWGWGRVVARELPQAWGGLLDADPADPAAVASALQRADGRDLALRDGELVECRLTHGGAAVRAWSPRSPGAWWLTGGTGAVGLAIAGWLVDRGVRHIVLTSRRGLDADGEVQAAAWRAAGARVDVLCGDVAEPGVAGEIRRRIDGPLAGVIHLAGHLGDAQLAHTDEARITATWRPKVDGAVAMAAVTREDPLDALVFVGSATSSLGIPGQAAYAMANAALRAVAHGERRRGRPALVVEYGPWSIGMASPEVRQRLEAQGIRSLTPVDALERLGRSLSHGADGIWLDLDPERHAVRDGSPRLRAFLHVEVASAPRAASVQAQDPASVRAALVSELLRVLGRDDASGLDLRRGFFDLGLDSMTALAFARGVAQRLGVDAPDTLAFDHGDLDALTAWATAQLTAAPAPATARRVADDDDPIAIIGMGCRFPGGDDPESFWRFLLSGEDAIGPVPPDRWDLDRYYDPTPGVPGRAYVNKGAFLRGVDRFDAAAFGIAPREALALDPQQRLLLEVGVEALEDAGQPLDELARTRTGVYVGIGPSDYGRRFDPLDGPIEPYAGTGNEPSFAAGRLAYVLGTQGPAVGMNTACSTSLVTLHMACQALRAGECELALAGGVHLMLSPETTVQLSQLQALSPAGRCATFDAAADGYARGEGCGVLVLKRLSDATRDGDRVLAVVRASAVNHDGPSAGLTVPSGSAQQALLRAVVEQAGVDPADVDLIEAHGTGTRLGDPIEVGAIKAVYGDRPAGQPLVLSAIKTHIGHLELAAGVAGVIAAVQAIRHRTFPPVLHFQSPNPAMDLDFPVRIPTEPTPWTREVRRAAVSSFGLSGTNAHVVLEGVPEPVAATPSPRSHHLLALSARTPDAVVALGHRVADALAAGADPADLAWSLHTGRSARPHRLSAVGADARELADKLQNLTPTRAGSAPVVWMFTGQGAQWPGMGQALDAAWSPFREVLDVADRVTHGLRGVTLRSVLYEGGEQVHDTAWTQPALFALEAGLASVLRSLGLAPQAMIGHSIGEYAAAWIAGVFDLETALTLVLERGRLMGSLPRQGAMAQVALREDQIRHRLPAYRGLDVAAVNTQEETVISGDRRALETLLAQLEQEGVRSKRITVSHAFHSEHMDPILDAFLAIVRRYTLQPAQIPVLSNVTARPETAALAAPEYWVKQLRGAVRFADGLRTAPAHAAFVEVGPHPVLSAFAARLRPDAPVIPTLRRDRADGEGLADAVGRLWCLGQPVDWRAWDAEAPRVGVRAPTTPWDRERFWVDRAEARPEAIVGADHLYATAWRTVPAEVACHGPWWIIGGGARAAALASALRSGGGEATAVDALPRTLPADVQVVDLRPLDVADPTDPTLLRAALADIQAHPTARWTFVTPPGDGPDEVAPFASAWRGLAAGLAVESPDRAGGVVEWLDAGPAGLAAAVAAGGWWRRAAADGLQTARLVPARPPAPIEEVRDTWWITGGLGALGLAFARWLLTHGAARVVLTSRRAADDAHAKALADLAELGEVLVMPADVSVSADVERVLAALADGPPLRGVIHAAGGAADAALRTTDWDRFAAAWPAKVVGAWNLHAATRHLPLDAFVLVSSAAGTLGWTGQAGYGTANAWLDGLARHRVALGLPALSLAWGPWSGGGMANPDLQAAMAAVGMRALAPRLALGALAHALATDGGPLLAVDLAWSTWHDQAGPSRELADELCDRPDTLAAPVAFTLPEGPERRRQLEAHVRAAVADALGLPDGAGIDGEQGLADLGLDSLMAVSLARGLRQRLGMTIPDTLAFDAPSVNRLIAWVEGRLTPVSPETSGRLRGDEPVCIVGMACRFPGADGLDAFWELLERGGDAIRPVPRERWDNESFFDAEPGRPGRTYVREGGFLGDVGGFEPSFFGISPREAVRMDPQQRLLLEVSWHALEHAGMAPDRLHGRRVGVFVGIGGHDYERIIERATGADEDDGYAGTGNDLAFAAGRIAYHLGVHGPALSLDTACSSSLVALHLAAEAVARGEAELALAGGVRLMLSPESTLRLSSLRALSPGARCRTFDADADGYARGEGCGVVVLKRLADARRDGDHVLAVVAGTAVNHDGPSSGLTVPSGPAQAMLLRQTLDRAGLAARDVEVIEAHGTGTALGDPIEVGALKEVFGERPHDAPLRIGSVKTNIGHLELAAGVAGVIKVVLAMQHGSLPGQLHFRRWNTSIDHDWPVRVTTRPSAWLPDHRRVAGVSAFGLSGTNAHVLLADPPSPPPAPEPARRTRHLLVLSATTEVGLDAQTEALRAWWAAHPDVDAADVGHTLLVGRARQRHRRAWVVKDAADAIEQLAGSAAVSGTVRRGAERPRVAMLFTGQGSQYAGMTRGLYDAWPVFRAVIDRCDAALRELRGDALLPVLFPRAGASSIDQTGWTQPALYAVEVALATLWRSFGVEPDLLIGHSIGELAAAHVAGMMSLEDGLRVVDARGRLMQALPQDGAMSAIFAPEHLVRDEVARAPGVDIAALNGPEETVISGDAAGVAAIAAVFEARGVKVRPLAVSHAFHSAKMDPILDAFEEVVRSVRWSAPRVPIVSNLTARPETTALTSPSYWRQHVRDGVRYAPAVRAAYDAGARWFVEVGPQPVLCGLGARSVPEGDAHWVPSLRRGQPDEEMFTLGLARIHTAGFDLDLTGWDAGARRARVVLPPTQFQRQRYYLDAGAARGPELAPAAGWQVHWKDAPMPDVGSGKLWWILADRAGVGDGVAGALTRAGHDVVVIAAHDVAHDPDAVLTDVWIRRGMPDGVLLAGTLDAGDGLHDPLADLASGAGLYLRVMQALPRVLGQPVPTWVLTRDAWSPTPRPAQTAIWGLGRVAALENRPAFGGLVDLGSHASDAAIAATIQDPTEDQVRLDGGARLVARLVEVPPESARPLAEGAVLITGGLGAVGLQIAERLVLERARVIVLNGRRPPAPEVLSRIGALQATGAAIHVVLGDVADEDEAARVVEQAGAFGVPLRAIVHAAGTLDDGMLMGLDWARFVEVARAKVLGALNLHAAAGGLDAFVLLSSATATFGAHGQGNYAVANAWLDGFAAWLRGHGRPAVSVAFGPWAGSGMAAAHLEQMERRGIRPLRPGAALEALVRCWRGPASQVTIAEADWPIWQSTFDGGQRRGLLRDLTPASTPAAGPRRRAAAQVHDVVADAVAEVLGLSSVAELDPDQGFFEIGLDSLMVVGLAERLSRALGRELPTSVVFDHPTVHRLARFLAGGDVKVATATTVSTAVDEPIAIVGMACRFPGADDVDAFWQLLVDGRSAVGEAPRSRWPEIDALLAPEPGTPGRTYTTKGAFLSQIEEFDAAFFGISPREAEAMDPQQRLLLEVCWEALEHAQVPPQGLRETPTGVYVGMGASEYDQRFVGRIAEKVDAYSGTGNDTSFAAGRIAYTLGFQGPAMTVNTACSASLVALHLACQALRLGECDLALAGGVNLMVLSDSTVRLSQLRALSPTGACRAFDAAADGYVRGEGAGVVVLERLSEARRRGHRVLAVVRATAVNHDGPSSALTVPSGTAQTALLRQAWRRAGINPDQLGYVEAHGTGTRLGDPIEARALATALGDRTTPLPVGSVKTNIGHLELAAGAAGLIKTILALRHQTIPPHLHLQTRNPEIPESLPLTFPTTATPWTGPRFAGVSSFGLSGTNAHVVLEGVDDDPPPAAGAQDRPVHLLALSARSADGLERLAHATAERVRRAPLPDVAHAMSLARTSGHLRLAVVGAEPGGVRERLLGRVRDGVFRGEVPARAPRVAWLYPGHGAGYPGMGEEVAATSPVFAAALDEVDAVSSPLLGRPLRELMRDPEALMDSVHGPVALIAWQVAQTMLLRSWGIEPDMVCGHGVGELVAAWVAGVWSLRDMVTFAVERGRAVAAQPPASMVSLVASEDRVRALIADMGLRVHVAAVNGPDVTVVGGPSDQVGALVTRFASQGIVSFSLPVRHALHTATMASVRPTIELAAVRYLRHPPELCLVSSFTGQEVVDEVLPATWWSRQIDEQVRFRDAVRTLDGLGATVFLEVGPMPGLLAFVRRSIDAKGKAFIATSRRDRAWESLVEAAADLWVRGVPLDFAAFDAPYPRQHVDVPPTPFERKRFWVDAERPASAPGPVTGGGGGGGGYGAAASASAHVPLPTLEEEVWSQVGPLLGLDMHDIPKGRPLSWVGMDSRMAVEIHRALEGMFEIKLKLDDIIAGPSADELVALVRRALHAFGPADIMAWLRRSVGLLLGADPHSVPTDKPMGWLGMDSLMGNDLKLRIDEAFSVDVPLALVVSGPSLEEIATNIARQRRERAKRGQSDGPR